MTNRIGFVLVILTLGLIVPLDVGGQTIPTPEVLVRQLGDPSFRIREQATERLLAIGRAAVPALEAGSKDSDLEVAQRCARILPQARRTDREILLDDLAAGLRGDQMLKLAGWERFRKLAGDDLESRQVFVETYRTAGDTLEVLETDKATASIQFSERCKAIRQRQNAVANGPVRFSFSEVMTALLLTTDRRLNPTRDDVQTAFSTFGNAPRTGELSSPAVSRFLNGVLDETGDPLMAVRLISIGQSFGVTGFDNYALKPVILRLIPAVEANSVETKPEQQSIQFFLIFGEKMELKEIIPLAKHSLKNKMIDPFNHVISIQIMVKLGGADAIRVIEESLTDSREMGRIKPAGGDWITHKVSDTALTALLILTDQTPAEYGFPYARAFPQIPTTLGSAADGFYNDRDREVAIQKWRKWRAKNRMR